jgi:isoleucyl-tRNA synthetase
MAPILSFTAEEIWTYLPAVSRSAPSPHLAVFPDAEDRWVDEALATRWERLIQLRTDAARVLEQARAARMIGASLDAHVTLYAGDTWRAVLAPYETQLPALLIVSGVDLARYENRPADLAPVSDQLAVVVSRAQGDKCVRCWTHRPDVGRDHRHPALCARCVAVVEPAA